MCTVTFLPSPQGVFITSNRDESPDRQAHELVIKNIGTRSVIFPEDPLAHGSWIALSSNQRAVCLLNGAFEPFVPKSSYRISRGIVVVEAAISEHVGQFLSHFNFEDIAPFTLLIYDFGQQLHQVIWDGEKIHSSEPGAHQPHIWSSVTLYPEPVRKRREELFDQWLDNDPEKTVEGIVRFHQSAHGDVFNDFIMDRQVVKTLSITNIHLNHSGSSIRYKMLGKNKWQVKFFPVGP